jgi:adenosine deaminase
MSWILSAPKAELHVHLEGTLEPEMLLGLAARNHVSLPYTTTDEVRAAFRFDTLPDFLEVYWAGLRVLRTSQDFYDLTYAYLVRARQDNVLHAEPCISPQGHTQRGIAFDAVMEGVLSALADGCRALGMTGGVILGLQRHRSEEDAFAVLEHSKPYRDKILGLGLGGPERDHPPTMFARVFAAARDLGWRTVAHAGEEGPASYVAEAVDVLGVDRVDHGVRCEEDPALVRRLAERQIPLTVCPLSNVTLKVFPRMESHNLRRLLHAGLRVTMNSDDPPYFGGYVNGNYTAAAAALGLTPDELFAIARNGFLAAFIHDELRASYLQALAAARQAALNSRVGSGGTPGVSVDAGRVERDGGPQAGVGGCRRRISLSSAEAEPTERAARSGFVQPTNLLSSFS